MLSRNVLLRAGEIVRACATPIAMGRILHVTGMLMEAHFPGVRVGELVEIERRGGKVVGEVVGLRDKMVLIAPLTGVRGVEAGAKVRRSGLTPDLPVSEAMLGRVVDVFGAPIDGGDAIFASERRPIDSDAPDVKSRAAIRDRFDTGIRIIDGLLTLGRGQRVGVFAGAGVGKTMLMREILARSQADVTVVGLIGERGCEVHDLLAGEQSKRSVVVAATSDRSPLERVRGAQAATAIAEHFRAKGKNVLLVIDSLTRYAMALREIGLAAGEPPATKGYPPSVFATMARLLERVAPLDGGGSITAVYTVLVEGDDLADPVADSARSLLDGHIVLSRDLAARGQFPAVDVLASTSRVAHKVTSREAQTIAEKTRSALGARREVEEMRALGAYVPGAYPPHDQALALGDKLDAWARQRIGEATPYLDSLRTLAEIIDSTHGKATAK